MRPFPYSHIVGDRPPLHDDLDHASPRQLVYFMVDVANYILLDDRMRADRDQPSWELCAGMVEAARSLMQHAIQRQKAEDRRHRRNLGVKRRV